MIQNKRYELKYVYDGIMKSQVLMEIKKHPQMLHEIYAERTVYNIYLDTEDFSNYHDNLLGAKERVKHRISWYNDPTEAKSPVLEYKCKDDKLGWKHIYQLPDFRLDHTFNWDQYVEIIRNMIPVEDQHIIGELISQVPILHNYYNRRYFMTPDGRFRVTVDWNLNYGNMGKTYKPTRHIKDDKVVLEVKFDESYAVDAHLVTGSISGRMCANSKYVTGVEYTYFYSL
ncbi:MAG: VTC domain-containing protein [Vallitaleaceae bacterium]|jgi:hypothetical protein|nr:VTC domain-containing protein [Vallitaleaceae bacterium]